MSSEWDDWYRDIEPGQPSGGSPSLSAGSWAELHAERGAEPTQALPGGRGAAGAGAGGYGASGHGTGSAGAGGYGAVTATG
jgi:hypothetical protein